MNLEIKGDPFSINTLSEFVDYLSSIGNNLFEYKGMTVDIDPTVNYKSDDVLIRWTEIGEGFNDKVIYRSLIEFKKDFILK